MVDETGKMDGCPRDDTPVLFGYHAETKRAISFKTACKRWDCPYCGEVNRFRWSLRAAVGAREFVQAGKMLRFHTLTFPGWMQQNETLQRWRASWPKLSSRWRRAVDDLEYMYIHEQHNDGRLHVHMISTSSLNTRWWKENAPACGFGYIVEEEDVRCNVAVAAYAFKHLGSDFVAADSVSRETSVRARAEMTKQAAMHHWPKGWRRVSTSRGWPSLEEWEKMDGWEWDVLFSDDQLHDAVYAAMADGYDWQHVKYRDSYAAMSEISLLARDVASAVYGVSE